MKRRLWICATAVLGGCATVVEGNERALYYSAKEGMHLAPVGSGTYWHAPWNDFIKYDLRWTSHSEAIHIHSKDGLHMDIEVAVVVRPKANELYELNRDSGPAFYDQIVRPSVFAATRDASAKFNHLEIATETHAVEAAIHAALEEHLQGQHLEVAEVAIQKFELPREVEEAANRKATAGQVLAGKELDLQLAQSNAKIEIARRQGEVDAESAEKRLRAEQRLQDATLDLAIEEAHQKAEKVKAQTEAENTRVRAQAEADAIKARALAERAQVQAASQSVSPTYLRLKALESLKESLQGPGNRVFVLPVGKDGLPAYFLPYLNPYGKEMNAMVGTAGK